MSQTIKIDQLADTVMKGMEEYAKLAADDLKKDVKKAGDTVKKQIESTAPKKTGKYSNRMIHKHQRDGPSGHSQASDSSATSSR